MLHNHRVSLPCTRITGTAYRRILAAQERTQRTALRRRWWARAWEWWAQSRPVQTVRALFL